MPYLVRKIEYGKWMKTGILRGEPPSADAITSCTRTSGNTLSTWLINDDGEMDDAVLAIASEFTSLDGIHVLRIDPLQLSEANLEVRPSEGRTAYKAFADRHRDIVNLDYGSLGTIAQVIVQTIKDERVEQIRKPRLRQILTRGVAEGRIDWGELKPGMQKHIPGGPLSEDDVALLRLVRTEEVPEESAKLLGLSAGEMRAQVDRICQVLGVACRADAICWACHRGFVAAA